MSERMMKDRYGRLVPAGVKARSVAFTELPIVDFAPMLNGDPSAKETVARKLEEACTDVGFFYLKNHGVPEDLVLKTFAQGRSFFSLPLERKMEIAKAKTPGFGGYSPMREMGQDIGEGNFHEAFNMNMELPADDPDVVAGRAFFNPNSWPAHRDGFRDTMLAYFDAMLDLGTKLFGAFALALDLPERHFLPEVTKPISMLRLNHYPHQAVVNDARSIGAAAHTDYECFTILAQDPNPELVALQVINGSGEWISVPHIPGTFVVNIGDQMARWTNDIFASTMHRVVNRSGSERDSIAFFFGTNFDTLMSTLPNCVSPERPSRYEPTVAGEYILGRINDAYGYDLTKKRA